MVSSFAIFRWMKRTSSVASRTCFFFQAEDGIRDDLVTGVQTCALPILHLCIVELTSPGAAEGREGIAGQRDPQVVRTPRLVIRARGAHQHAYLASIHGSDLTFGIGPAGTGKTYPAVACAGEAPTSERVRRLVL